MVEIPDSLRSVFSATVHEQDGTYVLEVPSEELSYDAVSLGETYRIAVFDSPTTAQDEHKSASEDRAQPDRQRESSGPPVEEGEVREVTIETVGDQGDGIAKVDRGYVVIVPDTQPGEQPTVEIEQVQENVAFASVVASDSRTL